MPQGQPVGLLNPLLNLFRVSFTDGGVRLLPDALWLIAIFFSIELLLSGMWFALQHHIDWRSVIQKAMLAAVLGWAVQTWPSLTNTLARGFMSAGLKIGGTVMALDDLFSPDAMINLGFQVSAVSLGAVKDASVLSPKALGMSLVEGWVGLLIVLFYFVAALAMFVTLLEYYLGAAFTTILLPWGMLTKTAWLAERAISHLFAGGVRLGLLALIMGIAVPALLRAKLDTTILPTSLAQAVLQLLVAITLCFLIWIAHRMAQAITSGSPTLAVLDMIRSAQSTQRTLQTLTNTMERVVDALSRLDPQHPSRQHSTPSRRHP